MLSNLLLLDRLGRSVEMQKAGGVMASLRNRMASCLCLPKAVADAQLLAAADSDWLTAEQLLEVGSSAI